MAEAKISKPKARSPQYPVIGLREAVAKAKAVYDKDYQNRIPKDVVAKHMGFNAIHGKSLGVIATLNRYGLLEGRGADYRITDRAVTIIAHPAGSPERIEAIRAAANAPAIFQELDKRNPDGKGSDEGMRAYLLTNKFIPDAAATAIRSYRETKRVVEAETKGYDSAKLEADETVENEQERKGDTERRGRVDPPERRLPPLVRRPPVMAGTKQDVFSLPEGEIVLQWPEPLSSESYEDFESWLKLVLRKVKRSVQEPGESPDPPSAESARPRPAKAGVSFIITQQQKETLRERGYTDEQIRDMKPEDAHRALGLIN